jgi:catechol 2,3-dioxygenase-like lactoylglutathione lyase family enzyme
MQASRVLETVLYCGDIESSAAFYRDVLGLRPHAPPSERHAFFHCGTGMLLLFNPALTAQAGVVPSLAVPLPAHGAHGPGHLAFAASVDEMRLWRDQLAAHGVAIEQEVQWPEGGSSFYFRDPSGNCLEFATPELWGIE